jgi:ribosomal protein S18 acetylase RimI-like enzyme
VTHPDTDRDMHREIRRATPADAANTAKLIAAAFHELEVSAWLVPDPAERFHVLTANFRIFVDHALIHGEIQLIDCDNTDYPVAGAVWFPQMTGPTPPPKDYDTRLATACGPATDRFRMLDRYFEDTHPDEFPHHYLVFLATHPGWRSRGLGTALLDHYHRELDRDRVPAFLHASNARTRDLYQRHGYHPSSPFFLPAGPPMWPSWREPANGQRI